MNAAGHGSPDHDLLHFVETDEFAADWESLSLDIETDIWSLQACLMADPSSAPIIRGTGGVRKVRFAPKEWKLGKSGGVRVLYAYFPRNWIVLLIMAYGKGRKETITAAECKALKTYMHATEQFLDALIQSRDVGKAKNGKEK